MSLPTQIPASLIKDAIAYVAPDGALHAMTDSMRALIEDVGAHLERLPLDDDQQSALLSGQEVVFSAATTTWALSLVEQEEGRWLLARDVTDRERYQAGSLASARCRRLGANAASLAHDLSNQFSATLALSSSLSFAVANESDRQTIAELEAGTKVGMRMVRSLARMLVGRGEQAEVFEAGAILEDALSLVRKNMSLSAIDLEDEVADGLPQLRVVHVEVVQAVMQGLLVLQMLTPSKVRCLMSCEQVAVGGGRERRCVVLRCYADGVGGPDADAVVAVVQDQEGKWDQVRQRPEDFESLALCVFGQQRLGGELKAMIEGDSLRLDYVWPAVG